jgi:hypothetical protein
LCYAIGVGKRWLLKRLLSDSVSVDNEGDYDEEMTLHNLYRKRYDIDNNNNNDGKKSSSSTSTSSSHHHNYYPLAFGEYTTGRAWILHPKMSVMSTRYNSRNGGGGPSSLQIASKWLYHSDITLIVYCIRDAQTVNGARDAIEEMIHSKGWTSLQYRKMIENGSQLTHSVYENGVKLTIIL